jgi:hypothetical protein
VEKLSMKYVPRAFRLHPSGHLEARVPMGACPHCGARHNGAFGLLADGMPPAPGDISVCIVCSGVAIFTERMHLRKPTPAEGREIARQVLIIRRERPH